MDIITQTDPRINELLQLARQEHLPLALAPETICALEDSGWLADPFTGQIWRDPAQEQTAPAATVIMLATADLRAQLAAA